MCRVFIFLIRAEGIMCMHSGGKESRVRGREKVRVNLQWIYGVAFATIAVRKIKRVKILVFSKHRQRTKDFETCG